MRVTWPFELFWTAKNVVLQGQNDIFQVKDAGKDVILRWKEFCTWYGEQSGRFSLLQTCNNNKIKTLQNCQINTEFQVKVKSYPSIKALLGVTKLFPPAPPMPRYLDNNQWNQWRGSWWQVATPHRFTDWWFSSLRKKRNTTMIMFNSTRTTKNNVDVQSNKDNEIMIQRNKGDLPILAPTEAKPTKGDKDNVTMRAIELTCLSPP